MVKTCDEYGLVPYVYLFIVIVYYKAEVRSLLEKKELTTRKKERKFEEEKEQVKHAMCI